jgi:DNA (cytosine-5)-methyltransferase 1
MKAIDLFCGGGGLSAGLQSAGFSILAGVDIEPKYMATFEYNFPSAVKIKADLSSLDPHDFMHGLGLRRGELDLLVGGPPCQGFSKNVPRKNRFLDDPKNQLVKTFLDYCDAIRPKAVLMENVAEMKNGFDQSYTDQIIERLTEEGFCVSHAVLNAADFGVPQRRRRAFFIGIRNGVQPVFPSPTHAAPNAKQGLFPLPDHVNVWDAIGDLPAVNDGEGEHECAYDRQPFSAYQQSMRNRSGIVMNHVAKKLRPLQYERLAALAPGQGLKDLPAHLKVGGGYSGAYGRLTKTMIAPTITRWVFHPGSGRWGHPETIRLLTMREVARIQSFPDCYKFMGTYNDQAGQLGNAVPALLARHLAESVKGQIG